MTTHRQMIALMAALKARSRSRVLETAREIIDLAWKWGYLGKRFTFDADADLDAEVNRLLLALSDLMIADTREKAIEDADSEEDKEQILLFIDRPVSGRSLTERVDSHASHLKYLLEGYLAVCFASGFSKAGALGEVSRFLADPNAYPPMQEAYAQADDYASRNIRQRGYHFGRGENIDPIKGIALVTATMLNAGRQYGMLLGWGRDSQIIGYRVRRGSDYDCPECDDLTIGIHPLDEIVLPAHPHCVCWMEPVRRGEE